MKIKKEQGKSPSEARSFIRNHPQNIMIVLVTFILLTICLGVFYYLEELEQTRIMKYEEVRSVARLKNMQINDWIRERRADARYFQKNPVSTAFLDTKNSEDEIKLFREQLNLIRTNHRYEDILVTDSTGKLLISLNHQLAYPENVNPGYGRSEPGVIGMNDFIYDTLNKRLIIEFVVPFSQLRHTRPYAYIIFRINPYLDLFPIVKLWPGQDKTANVMLFKIEGRKIFLINTDRTQRHHPYVYHLPMDFVAQTIRTAIDRKSGLLEYENENGIRLWGDIRPVENTSWYLLSQVERNEAVGDLNRKYLITGILAVLCIVLATTLIMIILRNLQLRTRKLRQEEQEQAEARFRSVFENASVGMSLSFPDGRIFLVNDALAHMTGISAEGMRQINFLDITHPEDREKTWAAYGELLNGEVNSVVHFEKRYIRSDGSFFWADVSSTLVKDHPDDEPYFLSQIFDITQRKEDENKLKQQRELILLAQKMAHIGFWYYRPLNNSSEWSEEMYSLFSYPTHLSPPDPDEIISRLHEDDRMVYRNAWEALTVRGISFDIRVRLKPDEESLRHLHIQGFAHRDQNTGMSRTFGFARDITDQAVAHEQINKMNQELELRVAERTTELLAYTKELEAFSYSVSHDLMAPLRAISGYSHALEEDLEKDLPEEGKDYLKRINAGVDKMSRLITDLLSLSMITRTATEFTTIDLSGLAEDIAATYANDTRYSFHIRKGLRTQGDKGLIRIALENLIGNAVKYSGSADHPEVRIDAIIINNTQYFYVKDNGVGFDMQYAHKLFIPFQRLHNNKEFSGNGIGLAIVRRIINKHGGDIWAESAPGKGTIVYFRFLTV